LNCLEDDPVSDHIITQPNREEFVFVRMLVGYEKFSLTESIDA